MILYAQGNQGNFLDRPGIALATPLHTYNFGYMAYIFFRILIGIFTRLEQIFPSSESSRSPEFRQILLGILQTIFPELTYRGFLDIDHSVPRVIVPGVPFFIQRSFRRISPGIYPGSL